MSFHIPNVLLIRHTDLPTMAWHGQICGCLQAVTADMSALPDKVINNCINNFTVSQSIPKEVEMGVMIMWLYLLLFYAFI